MRKLVLVLFLGYVLLYPAITPAQEVFSSGGGNYNLGSFNFGFTIGEPVIETYQLPSRLFTQGFQQPYYRNCINPQDGGRIGNPQSGCGDYDPLALTHIASPWGYLGMLEYLWVYSIQDATGPYDTLWLATDSVYDPAVITQTTWFKRLVKVSCAADWLNAKESNVIQLVVDPLPVPAFTANAVCLGQSTQFTNQSTGALSYTWDFDDNTTSIEVDPVHLFSSSGSFFVKLIATTDQGCKDSLVQQVSVNALPMVSLALLTSEICDQSAGLALAGGIPAGGTYTGAYVIKNNFYPVFSGPGDFPITYTYTDGNGCVSHDVQDITVLPLPLVSHMDMEACMGSGSLSLLGGSPTGGTYGGVYVNGNQFDVNTAGPGTYTVSYSYLSPDACLGKVYFTVTVHALPMVTHTIPSAVCEDAAPFQILGGSPVGGTYSGTGMVGGLFDPSIPGVGSHTLTYTWLDTASGCSNSTSLLQEVKALPLVSITPASSLCLGECIMLSASGASSYLWSTGPTSANITVCPTTSKNYFLTATGSNGCAVVKSVQVDVLPLPILVSTNDTICPGDTAHLAVSGGLSRLWNTGQSSPGIAVTPPVTTTYTVVVTGNNGCTAMASATAWVLPAPLAQTSLDTSICLGDCATLSASGGQSYLWSHGPITPDVQVCPNATTNYIVTVTGDHGCTASAQVLVTIKPVPLVNLGADRFICEGSSTLLTASGGGQYIWSTGETTAAISVNPPLTTLYQVTVTAGNACSASEEVLVNIWPIPQVTAWPDTLIMTGGTANLGAMISDGLAPYSITWSPDDYLLDPAAQYTTAMPLLTTLYQIQVIDDRGCESTDAMKVSVGWMDNAVHGLVYYANVQSTPLPGIPVVAEAPGKSGASALSNLFGQYYLSGLADGSHILTAPDINLPVGFVNSTDALRVAQHFVQMISLGGIHLMAADVNNDGNVNSGDALNILQYFVDSTVVFPAGRWIFERHLLHLSGDTLVEQDIAGLCVGDVNGSHIPFQKAAMNLSARKEGQVFYHLQELVEVPLYLNQEAEVGAISLAIRLPHGLEVVDVSAAEGIFNFAQHGSELRVAWANPVPLQLKRGEALLKLSLRVQPGYTDSPWALQAGSEIADSWAKQSDGMEVLYPELLQDPEHFSIALWPNPARDYSQLSVFTPLQGRVSIEMYDGNGRLVQRIHDGILEQGPHAFTLNTALVPAGVYQIRVQQRQEGSLQSRHLRLVIVK